MKPIRPREPFPVLLARLRTEASESLRSLAAKADVPHSYISNIEKSRRPVGQDVAARLADALKLQARDRTDFLLAATADSPRDKVVADVMNFPTEVMNSLALFLARQIKGANIERCLLDAPVDSLPSEVQGKVRQKWGASANHVDLAIRMTSGKWLLCDFKTLTV